MSYTLEKKVANAHFPRAPGSTLVSSERLNVVYNKYKSTTTIPADAIRFNFVFAHGTGMNKAIWHFHITQLFEWQAKSNGKIYIDTIVSVDAVGHGDSGVLNDGKLGWISRWDEGARDLLEVIRQEQASTGDLTNDLKSRNILVGHSMGGFLSLFAGFHEPNLVDSIVAVEPVLYANAKEIGKFAKRFAMIGLMLVDEFASYKDYEDFFKVYSFYKNIDPRVMEDFIQDELLVVADPVSDKKSFKTKTSKAAQIAAYTSGMPSLIAGMDEYQHINVPITHVAGKTAKWNARETNPFFRGAIKPEYLVGVYDVEGGEHLLHAEQPDVMVKILQEHTTKRQVDYLKHLQEVPEFKFKGSKEKILEAEVEGKLLQGRFLELHGYGYKLPPKL